MKKKKNTESGDCGKCVMLVKDSLDVLSGRWKLPILVSLKYGDKRFKQISRDVNGITDRMLSIELKQLEINQLIKRTVYDTFPPTVNYALTEHGHSLDSVILALRDWGGTHRRKIIGK